MLQPSPVLPRLCMSGRQLAALQLNPANAVCCSCLKGCRVSDTKTVAEKTVFNKEEQILRPNFDKEDRFFKTKTVVEKTVAIYSTKEVQSPEKSVVFCTFRRNLHFPENKCFA